MKYERPEMEICEFDEYIVITALSSGGATDPDPEIDYGPLV